MRKLRGAAIVSPRPMECGHALKLISAPYAPNDNMVHYTRSIEAG
jgi:hypothetical protein